MIDLDVEPAPFRQPWADGFEDRYRQFLRGRRKIAYYYGKQPDYSTFRYRIYNVVSAISRAGTDMSASYFTAADMPMMETVLSQADVLVLCRAKYDHHVTQLIALAKRRGCPVFFDIDDLVFDIDQVPLIVNTIGGGFGHQANWDYWFGFVGAIAATIPYCDKVIVTTQPLSDCVELRFGKPTAVLPNFLNEEQLEISERIYRAKEEKGFVGDGTIHLGYFSGSLTHNHDFDIVSATLPELLDEFPHLRLRMVGQVSPPSVLRSHIKRIELLPFQDFVNLQRVIGSTDINLVPLQNNTFTNCKSTLKFFEAAIVGTATIASPTIPFREAIEHGTTGLLARPMEWGEMIRRLIVDSQLSSSIAKKARAAAISRHSWRAQAESIMTALSAV